MVKNLFKPLRLGAKRRRKAELQARLRARMVKKVFQPRFRNQPWDIRRPDLGLRQRESRNRAVFEMQSQTWGRATPRLIPRRKCPDCAGEFWLESHQDEGEGDVLRRCPLCNAELGRIERQDWIAQRQMQEKLMSNLSARAPTPPRWRPLKLPGKLGLIEASLPAKGEGEDSVGGQELGASDEQKAEE